MSRIIFEEIFSIATQSPISLFSGPHTPKFIGFYYVINMLIHVVVEVPEMRYGNLV